MGKASHTHKPSTGGFLIQNSGSTARPSGDIHVGIDSVFSKTLVMIWLIALLFFSRPRSSGVNPFLSFALRSAPDAIRSWIADV